MSTVKPIPEDPNKIPDILQHIAECNAAADLPGRNLPHWPSKFHTQYTSCVLYHSSLSQPGRVPGSNGKAYLLSRNKLVPVTAFIRRCTKLSCSTRYSYSTWREGNYYYSLTQYVHVLITCTAIFKLVCMQEYSVTQ